MPDRENQKDAGAGDMSKFRAVADGESLSATFCWLKAVSQEVQHRLATLIIADRYCRLDWLCAGEPLNGIFQMRDPDPFRLDFRAGISQPPEDSSDRNMQSLSIVNLGVTSAR
ncbi:hypothetical protein [Aestuariivita boseongensis]|uniref:hypothetical protein n=1 Tax=Aestuariivita boseongensis TaxID=1470562 RepID=UPI0006831703|nr:hypothetical protein [Aestuariivita boseongensis]